MRVPNNLARGSLGFNMTPMIDVVLLLIIFFLVSSHLVRQDSQLELEELSLPTAHSGQPADKHQLSRVVVNVLPDQESGGRIMVGGRLMRGRELGELIAYGNRVGRRLEVRIRNDRKVP